MDKKSILLVAAGVAGLIAVARVVGKKEADESAAQIPEMPKPGTKVTGQQTLRGQYLNFLKELKELGYFDGELHYSFLLDQAIEWKDEILKNQIKFLLSSMMYDKVWFENGRGNFKPSSEKDVKAAIQRFSKENNINLEYHAPMKTLEPGMEILPENLTSGFGFGRSGRIPLWRKLRPLRMRRCPYAVGEDNV